MKPGITVGHRVRVAAELELGHRGPVALSEPQQPGADGVVVRIGPDGKTYKVHHDDGTEPWYHVDDLALLPCRVVVTAAGEVTPEQRRLDVLEAEVRELRGIFADWQERVGDQLGGHVCELHQIRGSALLAGLHRAAAQWWDAFDDATDSDPVDGPNDIQAKRDRLACAEENLQDALAALRDAGVHPSP